MQSTRRGHPLFLKAGFAQTCRKKTPRFSRRCVRERNRIRTNFDAWLVKIAITLKAPVLLAVRNAPQAVESLCTHLPMSDTSNNPHRSPGAKGKQAPTNAQEQSHSLKTRFRSHSENFRQRSRQDSPQTVLPTPKLSSQGVE